MDQDSRMDGILRAICDAEGLDGKEIHPLAGGQVNWVALVDRRYVIRLGARDGADQRLQQETNLLRQLSGIVPVPRVLAIGMLDGSPYQIQEYVRGEKLHLMWKELSFFQQEAIVAEFAGYRRALSALRYEDFGAVKEPEQRYPNWESYISAAFYNTLAEIEALQLQMVPGIVDLAEAYFSAHRETLQDGVPSLVHGDLWLGNILIDGGKITALLDFEYALQASDDYELLKLEDFCLYPNDYAEEENEAFNTADFAGFCTLLRKHDPELFHANHLRERLNLYHLLAALSDYLEWRKDNLASIPPNQMAAKNFYLARITNFIFDHGARVF